MIRLKDRVKIFNIGEGISKVGQNNIKYITADGVRS